MKETRYQIKRNKRNVIPRMYKEEKLGSVTYKRKKEGILLDCWYDK